MLRAAVVVLLVCRLPAIEAACGARVPYVRHEAEDGRLLGLAAVVGPSRQVGDMAGEASGRRAVRLATAGDGIEWTVGVPADGLVVRACLPDSADGSGCDADLAVVVNGRQADAVRLTSRYAWLYGPEGAPVNDPHAGPPRRIYDEARLLLRTRLRTGDRLALRRGTAGPPGDWAIDFIELEPVPGPLTPPADLLDVAAEGVTPENCTATLPALVARFAAPSPPAGKQGIWLPPGRWRLETQLRVPHLAGGFVVRGAGMWHTALIDERGREVEWGSPGFNLDGATALFADFAILGGGRTRKGGGKPFANAYGRGTVMRNLWIEHMTCGFWVGGRAGVTDGLRIEGCRLRNLGADGINLCNGTCGSVVVDTTVRYSGDDGIAIWSAPELDGPDGRGCSGNLIEHCTVELPWRAAGLAVYGGHDNAIRSCVVRDTLTYPGITISSGFAARPFAGTTLIEDVLLDRCGGAFWGGQPYGAIWIQADSAPVAGVVFRRVDIRAPTYAGIHLAGRPSIGARFEGVRVRDAGMAPVLVRADAGAVAFAGCDLGGEVERHGSLPIEGLADPPTPWPGSP